MGKQSQSEQIKFYVVIVLSIVAAVMAYFRFTDKPRPDAARADSPPAAALYDIPELPGWISSNAPLMTVDSLPPVTVDSLPYTPPRRDIFAPVAETPPKTAAHHEKTRVPIAPRLSGIMQGVQGSQAIIDGKIVRVGGSVGEYTVSEISPRAVILTSPTDRLVLTVGE